MYFQEFSQLKHCFGFMQIGFHQIIKKCDIWVMDMKLLLSLEKAGLKLFFASESWYGGYHFQLPVTKAPYFLTSWA